MNTQPHSQPLPALLAPKREVEGLIERVIAEVPPPRTERVSDAGRAAERVAREAAQKAAVLSGSLALPPGPIGMLTVLPDLYLIWKVQRQMVADIFALHGREAELTRSHMLYCLFRHMASQVARDVVVRAGQRALVQAAFGRGNRRPAADDWRVGHATRRRHCREPLGAARRRRRGRRLRLLGHVASREICPAPARGAARRPPRRRRPDDVRPLRAPQNPAAIALAFGLAHPPDSPRATTLRR